MWFGCKWQIEITSLLCSVKKSTPWKLKAEPSTSPFTDKRLSSVEDDIMLEIRKMLPTSPGTQVRAFLRKSLFGRIDLWRGSDRPMSWCCRGLVRVCKNHVVIIHVFSWGPTGGEKQSTESHWRAGERLKLKHRVKLRNRPSTTENFYTEYQQFFQPAMPAIALAQNVTLLCKQGLRIHYFDCM